jgi:hypothetical protein
VLADANKSYAIVLRYCLSVINGCYSQRSHRRRYYQKSAKVNQKVEVSVGILVQSMLPDMVGLIL